MACLWLVRAAGQEGLHPLEPEDRSSPRAALRTFLETGDALGEHLARGYLPSPSRLGFKELVGLGDRVLEGLDLSQVPPAARRKGGRAAALALYSTLNRIALPPWTEIPGALPAGAGPGTNRVRWTIPHTEIALERVMSGPREGEFLFSADTVERAAEFHAQVRHLPYARSVPLTNLIELVTLYGGWMVPPSLVQGLPEALRQPVAGQAGWKWMATGLLVLVLVAFTRLVHRLSRREGFQSAFWEAVLRLMLPVYFALAAPAFIYLALGQVNLQAGLAEAVELLGTAAMYLAGAWIVWRLAPVVAEAIISSPNIADEGIDAHLIRICSRLLAIMGAAAMLAVGADRLGIPVYGIVAGLGVGGLAIALAAQPTIENLIGGLNLFADRPMRVGDICRCDGNEGTVEAIGIRSTRIRGRDRTVLTIPNAQLSKISITNLSQRDRMLLQAVVGVRYETTPEQMRHLLARIRELLVGHARLEPDTARARFVGFGASSLDIEIVAYALTNDPLEFLGIREDVWLRVMELVEQSGSGFAFPSQTVYLARDGGLDGPRAQAAEAEVRQWRESGQLPFPEFSAEQAQRLRGQVPFPPAGSCSQPRPPGAPPGDD